MKSSHDQTELESYLSQHHSKIREAAGVPILLLQCMDSRYPSRVLDTMDSWNLRGKYDQLILAGASLGVLLKPAWTTTFMDQLEFAIDEHGVTRVFIFDHRDCGAYKEFHEPPIFPDDPAKEREAHFNMCRRATETISSRFPRLEEIHSWLLPIEIDEELTKWP